MHSSKMKVGTVYSKGCGWMFINFFRLGRTSDNRLGLTKIWIWNQGIFSLYPITYSVYVIGYSEKIPWFQIQILVSPNRLSKVQCSCMGDCRPPVNFGDHRKRGVTKESHLARFFGFSNACTAHREGCRYVEYLSESLTGCSLQP